MDPKLLGFLNKAPGLLSQFSGVSQAQSGINLIIQGADYEASQYRVAGASSIAAGNYNAALVGLNATRQLDALGREIAQTRATQNAVAAASGISSSSKSSLLVMGETLNQFNREIRHTRSSAQQQQASIRYEAATKSAALENQARNATYQGQVRAYDAQSAVNTQKRNAVTNTIDSVTSLLGI